MRLQLSDVRNAKYYCAKHECPLEPNSMSYTDPVRTKSEIKERFSGLTEQEIDAVVSILERFGHTACSQSPASRVWPEFMLSEGYFTCPAAEAAYAVDHAFDDPSDDGLDRALQADWPHWIMEVTWGGTKSTA